MICMRGKIAHNLRVINRYVNVVWRMRLRRKSSIQAKKYNQFNDIIDPNG